jgi:anaerobic ribonucleoside-triphosphate reductase activating protein
MLRVAKVIGRTSAEGPHERLALWVAGCDLACPGCCNPDLFDPASGNAMSRSALERLLDTARDAGVEGITVLGGEPLQQVSALADLLEAARARSLGSIVYTGYTRAQALDQPGFDRIWSRLDTLVDGPFDRHQPELRRRFIGSANQGLHHRTARYADPALWRGPARVEVRVAPGGQVEVHGLPRPVARVGRVLR